MISWRQAGIPIFPIGVLILGVLTVIVMRFNQYHGGTLAGRTSAAVVERGKLGYRQYCASCHGSQLQGQPDWKSPLPNGRLPAPPHDASGHTWHHPDVVLAGITRRGLKPYVSGDYESDMPAFEGILSEQQIGDILSYIKSTWPERERGYQMKMTEQSPSDPVAANAK